MHVRVGSSGVEAPTKRGGGSKRLLESFVADTYMFVECSGAQLSDCNTRNSVEPISTTSLTLGSWWMVLCVISATYVKHMRYSSVVDGHVQQVFLCTWQFAEKSKEFK